MGLRNSIRGNAVENASRWAAIRRENVTVGVLTCKDYTETSWSEPIRIRNEEGICAARGPGCSGMLRGQTEKDGELEMQEMGGKGAGSVSKGSVLFFLPLSVYISCPLWTGEEV